MRVVKAGYVLLDGTDREALLSKVERAARVCYKSGAMAGPGSAGRLVGSLVENGHEAMLEHYSFSVLFTVDRGVSHELVRHRMASFAQESTRYCNYSNGRFGGEITVIEPCYLVGYKDSPAYRAWLESCRASEAAYFRLLEDGRPEEARAVLPMSLKTELLVTANLREWRHILMLRAAGVAGRPHPQMLEVMAPLLEDMQALLPEVFGDIHAGGPGKERPRAGVAADVQAATLAALEKLGTGAVMEGKKKCVSEIIEDVKVRICDGYCKYSEKLEDSDIDTVCGECPLNRL